MSRIMQILLKDLIMLEDSFNIVKSEVIKILTFYNIEIFGEKCVHSIYQMFLDKLSTSRRHLISVTSMFSKRRI